MSTAADILREFGLRPRSTAPGRYYTTCPQCSAKRTRSHQNNKVLGITIDDKGVAFGCNHCGHTGGAYYNGKANGKANGQDQFEATYDYVDENEILLFQVCRKPNKGGFPQRHLNGKGNWVWGTKGIRKVLYRLPELLAALAADNTILVVEGEKDVNAAWRLGLPATCSPGGASELGKQPKWRQEYSETLRGADVLIIPDHDGPGYAHASAAAQMSLGLAKRVRMLKLVEYWPECPKGGDLSDWFAAGHTREELGDLIANAPVWVPPEEAPPLVPDDQPSVAVQISDFVSYMPTGGFIFMPARDMWPAHSVNARVPPVQNGSDDPIPAATWLRSNAPVEQMTWAPGEPMLINDRLISEGGWIERLRCRVFNLYRPPTIVHGNANEAGPWLDHIRKIYPADADHLVKWLAHRVQRPQEKINHAIVLGGAQGIGKDTLLEPVKRAVGPWNFFEVSPQHMLGRFNGFVKSVILRVSEARDLGDVDRFAFYDHLKSYTAAPPDVFVVTKKTYANIVFSTSAASSSPAITKPMASTCRRTIGATTWRGPI